MQLKWMKDHKMGTPIRTQRAFIKTRLASVIIASTIVSGCFFENNSNTLTTSAPTTAPNNDSVQEKTLEVVINTANFAAINRPFTLSAAGSSTKSGNALTYQWQVINEPEKEAGKILTASARNTRFLATAEGNYTIKLTVSDGIHSLSKTKNIFVDQDGDGIASSDDNDIDGDGVLNIEDHFPKVTAEWVDTDGNGVGNYVQLDEDGDDVDDHIDAYPFDPNLHKLFTYTEVEFNGNLYPNGNQLSHSYPLAVTGMIASGSGYQVDADYFLFEAKAGDIITLLLYKTSPDFQPTLALLNNAGASLPSVKMAWQDSDYLAISSRITLDGTHAFSVADINNLSSDQFTYQVSVFKDSDMDGIADETELALGMQPTNPDTDGDGILDGLEQRLSQDNTDQDGDLLPSWWDLDSDGDHIDDALEGVVDTDSDGISNFLDNDSDGNTIPDDIEIGTDPTQPEDSDNDAILDFVDTDDDNDSLTDTNDNDRLKPLVQVDLDDTAQRLVINKLEVLMAESSQPIERVARRGDTIRISGEGFGENPTITWQHQSGLLNFSPVVQEEGILAFKVPADAKSGEIKVTNGSKISYPQLISVVDDSSPLIFEVITNGNNSFAYAGSRITLRGKNLGLPNSRINLNGIELIPTSISTTSIDVIIPDDAASGMIAVVTDTLSNWLPIEIRQQTGGTVSLPSNSALTFDQLNIEFIGSAESAITSNGTFALPTRNEGPTTIHIFAPEMANREPAIFLSAVVLPGQSSINVNPYTMAAGLVHTSMGLEATIHPDDQFMAMEILLASTKVFGDYLDEKLGQDPYYLEDYTREDFVEAYLKAIESAGQALDAALTEGKLRQKTVARSSKGISARSSNHSGTEEVMPSPTQQDFSINLVKAGDTYSGKIEIENDTMLFADYKVLNAFNGNIIRNYANSYFSGDLLGPQSGIFNFYNANTQEQELNHRTSDLRIYTPGFRGTVWSEYRNSPSYKLGVRTFMSQAFVPVVNTVVGVRMSDSTTNAVLNVLFKYGAVEALESGWSKGTSSGFIAGVDTFIDKIISKSIDAVLENIVQAVAENQGPAVVKKMAVALGMKLTPWGSAATVVSVGGTAIDLGKLATDIASTNSYLEFRVNFPISVEEVSPSVIMVDGEPKEVVLKGKGLSPVIQGSIFGSNVHKPTVTFADNKQKTHIDNTPTYESYWVASGSSAPQSPLKVRLPADYLEIAESPLSITLEHHLIDKDPFVDDLVAVKLDTQFKIELVKELTLSSLNPDSGAWGDVISISGAGFSKTISDNSVYFTNEDGNPLGAMITRVSSTEITVVVPYGATTGPVWAEVINVNGTERSNELPFTLEQQMYTFTFGDNGSANDDTFALYVNGQLIRTMTSPSRSVSADVQLSAGIHQVELHGITAPDSIGTYYITFPQGISLISGDSMSGYDLTAGQVKRYSVEVQPVSPAQSRMRSAVSHESSVQILWQE